MDYKTPQCAAGYIVKNYDFERSVIGLRYLPDGTQMKKADDYTINEIGIPSLVLMERAAAGVVSCMDHHGIDVSNPLIVCGSGNNGGDGFAIARILKEHGKMPEIFFAGNSSSLSSECEIQKRIAEKKGIEIHTEIPGKEYSVIIDALFGVGLSREIAGRYAEIIKFMNSRKCYGVAVDIPSGICSRTGKVLGTAFRADLTVAMACIKAGCVFYPGREYSGKTVAVQIGIDPDFFLNDADVLYTYEKSDIAKLIPVRKDNSHKGTFGRVVMFTGCSGMAGAAYLSAKAAYSSGAGLVKICTHEDNRIILQQLLPEAVLSCYHIFEKKQIQELIDWADVICIGCGIGKSDISENILKYVLEHSEKTTVIDADGLNLLSKETDLLRNVKAPIILTPHMKEMSRLTGKNIEELIDKRMESIQEFSEKYSVVCVLKDSRTVVYKKRNHPFLNTAGNSAMAKAGSGDVLAGVITGLTAQGMGDYESAVAGVYIHACGGDNARLAKGSYSVSAEDLIKGIERVLKEAEDNNRD